MQPGSDSCIQLQDPQKRKRCRHSREVWKKPENPKDVKIAACRHYLDKIGLNWNYFDAEHKRQHWILTSPIYFSMIFYLVVELEVGPHIL